eukprot:COSAG04_NODE_177_length_21403_cov_37.154807_11_plen_615_part_00
MAAQTAESLVALLGGGPSERAAAYAILQNVQDAALGADCVAALASVLGQPASEVDGAEWRRCSLVIAQLAQLDLVRIGGEWYRDMRALAADAKGNAADVIVSQPAEQLTKEDMRTLAARSAIGAAVQAKGWDLPWEAGGTTFAEFLAVKGGQENAWNVMMKDDEPKKLRLLTLVLDLLREDRSELSAEAELAGAWKVLTDLSNGQPGVCLAAVQAGAIGLAIEELRTGSPADWVSIARNPSGKFAQLLAFISTIANYLAAEHEHLVAATPRLLDAFLDGLKAYEAAGSTEDANVMAVWGTIISLRAFGGVNRTAVRGVASSIRFALDHNLMVWKKYSLNTNLPAVSAQRGSPLSHHKILTLVTQAQLAASMFGRDEEGGVCKLCQQDVDLVIAAQIAVVDGRHPLTLQPRWSEGVLDIRQVPALSDPFRIKYRILNVGLGPSCSVSDHNKPLLLKAPSFFKFLVLGLFTDPEHPRGQNGTNPVPGEMQAIWQRNFAEILQQLALFPAGSEALLQEAAVLKALEEVAERGMSAEAREHAAGALMALSDKEIHASESGGPKHIMLSYQVREPLAGLDVFQSCLTLVCLRSGTRRPRSCASAPPSAVAATSCGSTRR